MHTLSCATNRLARELPNELPGLHRAASRWYASRSRWVPAIDHALEAGDAPAALALLRDHAPTLLAQGRLRLLMRWFDALLESLGDEALQADPPLQAIRLWALAFTRGPAAALASIGRAGPGLQVPAPLRALQPPLLAMMDRPEEAYALGRALLAADASPAPDAPDADPFGQAALINATANAAATLGRFDEARDLLEAARRIDGHAASAFHRMYSEASEGIIDLLQGRLRQAGARFRLALSAGTGATDRSIAPGMPIGSTIGNAFAGVLHALVVYEHGDLGQASRLLQVHLPRARDTGLPDHTLVGQVLQARLAMADGDVDRAFALLTELEYFGHERRLPRVTAGAKLERARLLMLQGHLDAARGELDRAGNDDLWQAVARRCGLANDLDVPTIARLRWRIAADAQARCRNGATQGDGSTLATLATQATRSALAVAIADAQARRLNRRALRLRMLEALALAGDDAPAGGQALEAVLRTAAAEGFFQLLVDEGPALGRLLQQQATTRAGAWRQAEPLLADYALRLLAAFRLAADEAGIDADPQAVGEALTRKEQRVLQLLAEGYSNAAMAEKLFVSDSTVRTHLRNLNAKLGARNRTQAVAIGRRRALIR